MHPMSRPGDPPYDFGDPFARPQHARPGPPPSPGPSPKEPGIDDLRRRAGRLDRRLISVNAAGFAALVVLAGAAPGLLATEIVGSVNLGLLLCAALGLVSLYTSLRYDRRRTREVDPEAQQIRARHEARAAALEAAAQRQAAPSRRWSGW